MSVTTGDWLSYNFRHFHRIGQASYDGASRLCARRDFLGFVTLVVAGLTLLMYLKTDPSENTTPLGAAPTGPQESATMGDRGPTQVAGVIGKPNLDGILPSSTGVIDRPSKGNITSPSFFAAGIAKVTAGEVLWLFVRKGRLYYPKEDHINVSGPWRRTVHEGGPSGPFELVLVAVRQEQHRKILTWFDDYKQTGEVRPMLTLKGKELDVRRLIKG